MTSLFEVRNSFMRRRVTVKSKVKSVRGLVASAGRAKEPISAAAYWALEARGGKRTTILLLVCYYCYCYYIGRTGASAGGRRRTDASRYQSS